MTEYAVIDGQRVALTEWFPAEVKPAHPGVYESDSDLQPFYRYWDSSKWHAGCYTPDGALDRFNRGQVHLIVAASFWRGLSHPPGAT